METMSLCAGFLLAEYIWYCFIYRAKSNLFVISCSVFLFFAKYLYELKRSKAQ